MCRKEKKICQTPVEHSGGSAMAWEYIHLNLYRFTDAK